MRAKQRRQIGGAGRVWARARRGLAAAVGAGTLGAGLGAGLGGCGVASEPRTFAVAPGGYVGAFDAARVELLNAGFTLERVDAARGVLSTTTKTTAGLATPWDGEQETVGQEWQDFVNRQARVIRVTFGPPATLEAAKTLEQEVSGQIEAATAAGDASAAGAGAPPVPASVPSPVPAAAEGDLRLATGPLAGRVEVVLLRQHRPGYRAETESARLGSTWVDPLLAERGLGGAPFIALRRDDPLAATLTRRVVKRMEREAEKQALAGAE